MKKYITPEVEIARFNTEDIMTASGIDYQKAEDKDGYANAEVVDTVSYNTLFGL